MALGNEEFMHGCFPKQSLMGPARMKSDKETGEVGKKRSLSMKRSKMDMKKRSPDGLSLPNQNTIIINIIIIYHDFLPTPRRISYVKSDKTHTSHQDWYIKTHP